MIMITLVPREAVDVVWEDLAPLLGKAVATVKGKFRTDYIQPAAMVGELCLWAVKDGNKTIGAFTTRVIQYPERRALAIDWVGGERIREWLDDAMTIMEHYAKDYSCQHLEGYGRRAWGRMLERFGWEPEYIAFRKELTDE